MAVKTRPIRWSRQSRALDIAGTFRALHRIAPRRVQIEGFGVMGVPTRLAPAWFDTQGRLRQTAVTHAITRGWHIVSPDPSPLPLVALHGDAYLLPSEPHLAHLLDGTSFRTLRQAGLLRQPRTTYVDNDLASVRASTLDQLYSALLMYCLKKDHGVWTSVGLPTDPADVEAMLITVGGQRFLLNEATLKQCEFSIDQLRQLAKARLISLRTATATRAKVVPNRDAPVHTRDGRTSHTKAIDLDAWIARQQSRWQVPVTAVVTATAIQHHPTLRRYPTLVAWLLEHRRWLEPEDLRRIALYLGHIENARTWQQQRQTMHHITGLLAEIALREKLVDHYHASAAHDPSLVLLLGQQYRDGRGLGSSDGIIGSIDRQADERFLMLRVIGNYELAIGHREKEFTAQLNIARQGFPHGLTLHDGLASEPLTPDLAALQVADHEGWPLDGTSARRIRDLIASLRQRAQWRQRSPLWGRSLVINPGSASSVHDGYRPIGGLSLQTTIDDVDHWSEQLGGVDEMVVTCKVAQPGDTIRAKAVAIYPSIPDDLGHATCAVTLRRDATGRWAVVSMWRPTSASQVTTGSNASLLYDLLCHIPGLQVPSREALDIRGLKKSLTHYTDIAAWNGFITATFDIWAEDILGIGPHDGPARLYLEGDKHRGNIFSNFHVSSIWRPFSTTRRWVICIERDEDGVWHVDRTGSCNNEGRGFSGTGTAEVIDVFRSIRDLQWPSPEWIERYLSNKLLTPYTSPGSGSAMTRATIDQWAEERDAVQPDGSATLILTGGHHIAESVAKLHDFSVMTELPANIQNADFAVTIHRASAEASWRVITPLRLSSKDEWMSGRYREHTEAFLRAAPGLSTPDHDALWRQPGPNQRQQQIIDVVNDLGTSTREAIQTRLGWIQTRTGQQLNRLCDLKYITRIREGNTYYYSVE